ncbi:arginase family protein [Micromonospora sp. C81]|uniref:arginase family protein n=1 Tax=Micromonospora sp. C81 TaxID=2824881 RepID=UPI001B35FD08|nr:arginase family protein [Micromonospora sp. C81]MBQ1038777.1 arginase family protein [Micromonospora sp. C81]
MWSRDLDVLVPTWQGADDLRLREGATALAALTTPGTHPRARRAGRHSLRLLLLDASTLGVHPARLAELPPPDAAVYVHLDLDVLDPSALPAVAVPTPDGLTTATLTRSLTALRAHHQVAGVGITEYVPQLAHDQQVLNEVLDALGLTGARPTAPDGGVR